MNIAIYPRKSVYSDKSDSVESQIKICTDYANNNYNNITSIVSYGDEGFTGANTNRPGFTKLMDDVVSGRVDIVICYKIDRISRNVLDFSKTFNILQEHNVQFVSVKEQIDTSTPLGRAMMYICSVFAQMERETIAERVKDNMIELAKSGKWAGGQAPVGFKLKKINVAGKTHTTLIENPEEIDFLNMVFDKFLEGFTLSGLETYFRKNNVRSPRGSYFSASQMHTIMKNPHYVAATPETYDFFKARGCSMVADPDKFDGAHGLIVYGRTNGGRKRTHVNNPPEKWMVSVGIHKPLISAEKWLAVQARFGKNKIDRTRKHDVGLLKGLVKCKCGYTIRVQHKVDKTYNKIYNRYFCQNRNRRGIEYCDMKQVSVSELDNLVINFLKDISLDKSLLEKHMQQTQPVTDKRTKVIVASEIKAAEKKISNLTVSLQDNLASSAAKYIIAEIEKLDKLVVGLNYEMRELSFREQKDASAKDDIQEVHNKICEYVNNFESYNYAESVEFLHDIIKECIWDGVNLVISF